MNAAYPTEMARALAIPNSELAALGLKHTGPGSITNAQRLLIKRLVMSGAPNTTKAQAGIARAALVRAGLPSDEARMVVAKAVKVVESRGVMAPAHMPWH